MKRWLLNPEVCPIWGTSDEGELLAAYERVWERKRILRSLYETWYRMIESELRPGPVLEVGAGTGNFKRWLTGRRCYTLDILPGRFVDVQADAMQLPFSEGSVSNIVMIDALHHFARPLAFLQRASLVLHGGGRLVMLEPFVSAWGWFVYRYFHHERVDFGFQESDATKQAWDGNAAIPQMVLSPSNRPQIPMNVLRQEYLEFLSYPLSGGFSYRSLLPGSLLLGLHRIERISLFRNRWLSLRMFTVLEKPSS